MAFISKADVHLIVAIFLGALIGVQAWDSARNEFAERWGTAPAGEENLSTMAQGIFGQWAVPFEVLSLLLLVALIGAIAMAIKDEDDRGGAE